MAVLNLIFAVFSGAGLAMGASQEEFDLSSVEKILDDLENAFEHWMLVHNRQYATSEELQKKRGVFEHNARFVASHNAAHQSVHLSLNHFADLTFEEFSVASLGFDMSLAPQRPHPGRLGSFRYQESLMLDDVDWVPKGAVTPVKNQGSCGSCWAFSTTGSIEGVNFLETGELVNISEQELVDCDRSHDLGCGGGLMDNAFQYVLNNGGIDTEKDYPYWGATPSFCNHRKERDRHVIEISGFEDVPPGDEEALARAVSHQPISVAICVNRALMFYHSGVFDAPCCSGLNHGVLLVGYGEDGDGSVGREGGAFWKIKNSWGPAWGEEGYFRLARGVGGDGQCGITKAASYPVKDDHVNPKVPTICDPLWLSLWECPADTMCSCDFSFFGLFCFIYSCPPVDATQCGTRGYCPSHAPVCDVAANQCRSEDNSEVISILQTAHASRHGSA